MVTGFVLYYTKLFKNPEIIGFGKQGKLVDRDVLSHCMEMHRMTVSDYDVEFEEWALQKTLDS